jgi:hypothetical protein
MLTMQQYTALLLLVLTAIRYCAVSVSIVLLSQLQLASLCIAYIHAYTVFSLPTYRIGVGVRR